jgi:hypothetical protein
MKAFEHERYDWIIILIILLIGFLCMLAAGQWALRFSPSWKLNADMESNLDPNSDFLTRKPSGFIEPVDPAILTNPVWINVFLTPGASFTTATALPKTTGTSFTTPITTGTLPATQTTVSITTASPANTAVVTLSPTNAIIFFPPSPTSTPKPQPADTSTATSTSTSVSISTTTPPASPTSTATLTSTFTFTPASMFTNTPDPSEPDFGGPDANTLVFGNGVWVEFNLSGFLLDGNSPWDVVYYEKEEASSAGKIHMGAVLIEVYDQTTAAWYTVYNWGDGIADANASYNNGNSEPDSFPVEMSLLGGVPPLNTGIAIDIDTPALGQGGSIGDSITKIRITSQSNANCEVDALQMLR